MSTAAPPDCPFCRHNRRVKVLEYSVHCSKTGQWSTFEAWACDGCWIVVQEIPGTRRVRV